jgi:ribonuclease-3
MSEMTFIRPIDLSDLALSSLDEVLNLLDQKQRFAEVLNCFSYRFKDSELFLNALTHTSAAHEFGHLKLKSNEKLEFLGDAVLEVLVTTLLWQDYPELLEGDLSKLRSALVKKSSLAELARAIDLGPSLFLGKGELISEGFAKDGILADCLEALIGAIYLDGGFNKVRKAFNELLAHYKTKTGKYFIGKEKLFCFDPKSQLQELTMREFKVLPSYHSFLQEDGLFQTTIFFQGISLGRITAKSKKEGENQLAQKILRERTWEKKACS